MPRRLNVSQPPRVKPLMIWDGDCLFCEKWIRRWEQTTNGEVDYVDAQSLGDRFPEIPRDSLKRSVHFVGLDGLALEGAEAVFACLAFAGRYRFLLGLYHRLPWFASVSEALYAFIARNRSLFSHLTSLLWGKSVEQATFSVSGSLFLRLLGLIYVIAFASFGMQSAGLVGSQGILPLASHLEAIDSVVSANPEAPSRMWLAPTLLWLNSSDTALNLLIWVGALAGVAMMLGLAPVLCAMVCWLLYLSLVNAAPLFLHFQWDVLLLETGFLAILLAPWVWLDRLNRPQDPPRIVRWLVWWLLFRLMFESGLVKLFAHTGGEPNVWLSFTALNYHYMTQPLPNGLSWYWHALPDSIHRLSVLVMFFIELVIPFMIAGPRRIRNFACAALALLQVAIMLTGNYGFFNLLTLALCVSLIDDQSLASVLRLRLKAPDADNEWRQMMAPLGWLRIPVAAVFLFFGSLQIAQSLGWDGLRDYSRLPAEERPPWSPLYNSLSRLHILNNYGLFAAMTTERPEIIIEGSRDGVTWKTYEFRYKPGPLDRRPQQVAPHMPRLDWQLWFAALEARSGRYPPWIGALAEGLAQNRPEVTGLLKENPFPGDPPTHFRVQLYDYDFTRFAERKESGDWWKRTLLPEYTVQFRIASRDLP